MASEHVPGCPMSNIELFYASCGCHLVTRTNDTHPTPETVELYKSASPRPWESDGEKDRDGPDRHTYYQMFDANGVMLFDTLNSNAAYLHQDYDSVWDEQGRVNFAMVAHAVNNIERLEAHTASLSSKLERAEKALEWQPIETAPKDGTEIIAHDATTGTSHVSMWTGYQWHDPDNHYYSEAPDFVPTLWKPLDLPPATLAELRNK